MAVRVAEVARIPPIERRLGLVCHSATCLHHCRDYFRNLALRPHVVREHDAREASTVAIDLFDAGVQRELLAAPQRQHDATCLEENRLFDFLALPAQLLVEPPRTVHVRDTEGDEAESLLHRTNLTFSATDRRSGTDSELL